MQYLWIIPVTLLASMLGAVCGIGGGVVIKPVLDATGFMSAAAVSFLSGCTVLCMTLYSVVMNLTTKNIPIRMHVSVSISFGAAIGGIIGKNGFQMVSTLFENKKSVGAVQAGCLFVLTFGTLLYTLNKQKIHTRQIENCFICMLIGLVLGVFSSFLGIGGGPFNLVFLSFFFSMETKEAAQTSLLIIMFSQITSLGFTVFRGLIPDFQWEILAGMAGMGILGAVFGRKINNKLSSQAVDKMFIGITTVIMGICVYNML